MSIQFMELNNYLKMKLILMELSIVAIAAAAAIIIIMGITAII